MSEDFEVVCSGHIKDSRFKIMVAGEVDRDIIDRIVEHLDLMKQDFPRGLPDDISDIMDWVAACVVWDHDSSHLYVPQEIYDHYVKWHGGLPPRRHMNSFCKYFARIADGKGCKKYRGNRGRRWGGLKLIVK